MAERKRHAPRIPGLLQALGLALLVASALGALHHQVGISYQSDSLVDRVSINTQVTGLIIASLGGGVVGPEAARSGDIPGMELVETPRGRSFRPPFRYLAAIWAGNLVLLTLIFYLPVRWWHDRRYRAAIAAAGAATTI